MVRRKPAPQGKNEAYDWEPLASLMSAPTKKADALGATRASQCGLTHNTAKPMEREVFVREDHQMSPPARGMVMQAKSMHIQKALLLWTAACSGTAW